MALYIFILLLISNAFMGLNNQQSKLLILVDIIFIWLLIAGYAHGVDIDTYRYRYDNEDVVFVDIGYTALCSICQSIGMTFFGFKAVATAGGMLLMLVGLKRLHVNLHFVLTYFMAYQVLMDTIQYRNFLGWSLLIYALPYWFRETRRDDVKYAVLIILAATFHIAMLANIIFLSRGESRWGKFFQRCIICGSVALIVLTVIGGGKVPYVNVLLDTLGTDNAQGYTVGGSTGGSIAYLLSIFTVAIWVSFYSYQKKIFRGNKKLENLIILDTFSVAYLPFCIMSFQWYRLVRNINLINICGLSWCYRQSNIVTKNRQLIVLTLLMFVLVWFYADVLRFVTWENMRTVFENNIYFNDQYSYLMDWWR